MEEQGSQNSTFWKTEYLIAQLRTGIWRKFIRLKTCPQGDPQAKENERFFIFTRSYFGWVTQNSPLKSNLHESLWFTYWSFLLHMPISTIQSAENLKTQAVEKDLAKNCQIWHWNPIFVKCHPFSCKLDCNLVLVATTFLQKQIKLKYINKVYINNY